MRHFIVTDQQAGKLPRWALLLLCALYVFPGLIGREPWRTSDAAGFATSLTMLRGNWQDWLIPNIAGEVLTDEGPFAYALLAGINKILALAFGPTAVYAPWPHWVAMLSAACGLMLMLACFWQAAYQLAKRPGLQPLDPFGAAASRIDFARAIADTGLLVLIASLGLLVRMHEISSIAATVTWVSVYLLGMAISLDSPRRGALLAAFGCAAIFMTRSPVLTVALVFVTVFLFFRTPAFALVRGRFLAVFLPVTVAGCALWPALLILTLHKPSLVNGGAAYFQHFLALQGQELTGPSVSGMRYLLRSLPWFFWPAWPLAAYSAWRWRGRLSEPAIALPLAVFAAMALLWLINPRPGDANLAVAAPVMALLAAPGLATLKRSLVNMIDWFAVACFTFAGFALWLYWFALLTGFPEKIAFRASQFAPHFVLGPIWLEIVLGGLASACWLLLVRWRISRHPPMIWRAVVLSASGLTLVWFLMMTLWLPILNERMGFRNTATALGKAHFQSLSSGLGNHADCVNTRNLELAPRASFYYYSHLRFASEMVECSFLLEQTTPDEPVRQQSGDLIWRGAVPAYRDDEFRLYRHKPVAATR